MKLFSIWQGLSEMTLKHKQPNLARYSFYVEAIK